jgi:flagellar P-ring protein precursor FlgI
LSARVSTIGDAKSLEGGTLSFTELTNVSGEIVFVTAAGALTVGGFRAEGKGATAIRNHVTVATLPNGAKVQREVPTSIISDHGFIYLDARLGQDTFGNTVRITDAINSLYPGVATAMLDGKTVRVGVPVDLPEHSHLAYLSSLLNKEVESENVARVLVDESSGLIVMGGDVRLRPGLVVHGNLTVTIAETPQVSQPGPFSNGTTEIVDRTNLQIHEENNGAILVPGAANLKEVADVLNLLGTTPRDTISILQGMQRNGLLVAELQRL